MTEKTLFYGIERTEVSKNRLYVTFWIMLRHLPQPYVAQALEYDPLHYADDCFGFAYTYSAKNHQYRVEQKDNKELYYLDENGDRHYMDYQIPKNVLRQVRRKTTPFMKQNGLYFREQCGK